MIVVEVSILIYTIKTTIRSQCTMNKESYESKLNKHLIIMYHESIEKTTTYQLITLESMPRVTIKPNSTHALVTKRTEYCPISFVSKVLIIF